MTSSIKQTLNDAIHYEFKEIERLKKGPPPETSMAFNRMTQEKWGQLLDAQEKTLSNLKALIDRTSDEKLPDVLVAHFLEEEKFVDQYPPIEPYMLALGEQIIPAIAERFDQAGPRIKERLLLILGNTHSRKALPVVRKALDDQNQRVILEAQTALRLILGLEAKPELEKMLVATKSSWALKHTIREISLIGEKDWYEDFFKLAKSNKVSLRDLALIGDPLDCPEAVIGENLDFIMNAIRASNDPEIRPTDIYSSEEFLSYLQGKQNRKSQLMGDVEAQFEPRLLEGLKGLADATELTGEHELAIIASFNRTKDEVTLFPGNALRITLKTPDLKDMFKDLLQRGIFIDAGQDKLSVKEQLTPDELMRVKWFNVYLLRQEFPSVISRDKNGNGEEKVARQMLSKLSQRVYLRQIYPLLTEILHDRYCWGGKVESFGSSVTAHSDKPLGFRDSEAGLILKNIALNLLPEDVDEWLKNGSADLLTKMFLEDLQAQKKGGSVDLKGRMFLFRISVRDRSGRTLASSEYELRYGEEQNIVLASGDQAFPEHKIKLKVQLDREKWLFHLDPILIDLKPYAAGFDVYIPFGGANETPLTETLNGQKEQILWRFEHIDKDQL